MVDNLAEKRKNVGETQEHPYGVTFAGSPPLSPYTLLGQVLERKGLGIKVNFTKSPEMPSVYSEIHCATDADAKLFQELRRCTEMVALDNANRGHGDLSIILGNYHSYAFVIHPAEEWGPTSCELGYFEIHLKNCSWSATVKDQVRAYKWAKTAGHLYSNYLCLREGINYYEGLQKSRIEANAQNLLSAAKICKSNERKRLDEGALKHFNSDDIAGLISVAVDRYLSKSSS